MPVPTAEEARIHAIKTQAALKKYRSRNLLVGLSLLGAVGGICILFSSPKALGKCLFSLLQ